MSSSNPPSNGTGGAFGRVLAWIERAGNRLPDPAMLFVVLLALVWVLSALLAPVSFSEIDPRTGAALEVRNQLSGAALAGFFANMVTTFTSFHPLGVVLVALLGVGVAERSGLIHTALRGILCPAVSAPVSSPPAWTRCCKASPSPPPRSLLLTNPSIRCAIGISPAPPAW
ncbi:MAG: AbgT family transporter [Akkermansiaceae bacterium]|nr:AbgT family transporter [Akkermansiaceae bacterium]